MHGPLNRDAVRYAMPAFFDLRRKEPHPSVRVVLGLFIFIYTHAYIEWQRPRRALPDEHNDGVRRIPMDGHSGNRPQRLREGSRKSECRRRYRALRGLPRRSGEEAAGWRALVGGAESVVRRRTLKQFSICGRDEERSADRVYAKL